ncbi:MAG: hypothetical protein O7H41_00675 [Planctomycetota bacterium]|nr:hypothetical protein [Planctomycetota bacterium]
MTPSAYSAHVSPSTLSQALDPRWLEGAASSVLSGPVGRWREPVLLAGGWYTHLAVGRLPRDLDLFCTGRDHLEATTEHLVARGARVIEDRPPFYRRHLWSGQVIDLVYNVWSRTLEDLFRRFDLGLSMVGVKWLEGKARAAAHPLALRSARDDVVYVSPSCPNTKYTLVIIERARRYAARLGLGVDEARIAWLWSLFSAATPDERERMLQRYRAVGVIETDVEAQALALMSEGDPQ